MDSRGGAKSARARSRLTQGRALYESASLVAAAVKALTRAATRLRRVDAESLALDLEHHIAGGGPRPSLRALSEEIARQGAVLALAERTFRNEMGRRQQSLAAASRGRNARNARVRQ